MRLSLSVVGPAPAVQQFGDEHVGSIHIDLALDHLIDEATYETIKTALIERNYTEGSQPFIFFRDVPVPGGNPIK